MFFKKTDKTKKKVSMYILTMGSILMVMSVFAILVLLIGNYAFTKSFEEEYYNAVLQIADLAEGADDIDDIRDYLQYSEEELERVHNFGTYMNYYNHCISESENPDLELYNMSVSYYEEKEYLQNICDTMGMSVINIIEPSDDYEEYTVIFDCLNSYSRLEKWEMGRVCETTNDNYKNAYKKIYEDGSNREVVERMSDLGFGTPHITALVPIYNNSSEIMGILTVQRNTEELTRARRGFAQGVGGLTIILVIISFIIEARLLRTYIVTPISVISKEAGRFAKENTRGSYDLRDYDYLVKEIYDMSSAIESMEEDTLNNIENIKTIVSEQERIGADLELASRIQFGMLPKEDQIKEDIKEFDIEAIMQPAREVGGDFYDFYMISDNELVIEIADVSDKGLAAAFFMAITKTLIASRAGMGGETSDIISYVDKMVSEKNDTGMFVTVWFAIINLETGHVKVCNAGHDYPAVMKDGQEFVIEKTPHGPPIGFIPGATFVDYDFYIKPGDRIFLYTDGLNEAKRSDGERFGLERVLKVLNSQKDSSNKQLIAAMKDSVKMFVGNEPQFDDTTMLSFTFNNYKKS